AACSGAGDGLGIRCAGILALALRIVEGENGPAGEPVDPPPSSGYSRPGSPMTVYLVRDLVFTSKIRDAAERLGVAVEGVRQAAAVVEPARRAQLVIVDLRLPDALEALELLAGDPEASAVATVGFVDHERLDVMETARALGCRHVLAKGEFANKVAG